MTLSRLLRVPDLAPAFFASRQASQLSWNIQKFLVEIGSNAREARYWLKVFQDRDSNLHKAFAVISIDRNVFAEPDMLTVIGSTLAFLNQNDLKTVLVHGFDEQRSTTADKHGFFQQAQLILDVLHKNGVSTSLFLNGSGIIHGSGKNITVDTSPLEWSLSEGRVPVLSSVAELDNNRLINIAPSKAATLISSCIQPAKVIHLNATGGIRNTQGKVIGEVTLPCTDHGSEAQPSKASQSMIALATEALTNMPLTSSVVVTSANSILKELFTHRGSGTIFRNREPIHAVDDLEELDKERLVQLLQRTFKRHVCHDYVKSLEDKFLKAYVTSSYSAAAIITQKHDGCSVPYLDKFAVLQEHQGLGTGEVLWDAIRKDFKSLFWRSRPENKINPWYFSHAEGSWSSQGYIVFWYGVNDPQLSHTMINAANGLSSTFEGPILPNEDKKYQMKEVQK